MQFDQSDLIFKSCFTWNRHCQKQLLTNKSRPVFRKFPEKHSWRRTQWIFAFEGIRSRKYWKEMRKFCLPRHVNFEKNIFHIFSQKYQEQLSSWTVFTFGIIHVEVRKISRKTKISYPLIRAHSCAFQGVWNFSFSGNFANVLNELPLFK